MLIAATALPFGTVNADGPIRLPVNQEKVIDSNAATILFYEESIVFPELEGAMFNHSSVGLLTASDSIQEPVEVQWGLEDIFNHSSVGLPTASDSIRR